MQNKALQKKPSSTVYSSGLYPTQKDLRKKGRKSGFQLSNKNNRKTLNLTSLSEESRKQNIGKDMICKRMLHRMSVIFMSTVARTTTKLKGNSY